MTNKLIVQTALQQLLSHIQTFSPQIINQYFSTEYKQTVNGKELAYPAFMKHIQHLQQVLQSVTLNIMAIAQNDNIVFTHHQVLAIKKDGSQVHTQVIAQFTLYDDKIIQCDELTYLLSGTQQDEDLGSRVN